MYNPDAIRSSLYKVVGGWSDHQLYKVDRDFQIFSIELYKYFQKPEPNDLIDYISEEDVVDVDCLDALSKITFCFLTFSN